MAGAMLGEEKEEGSGWGHPRGDKRREWLEL